jgi:hypothetical protein
MNDRVSIMLSLGLAATLVATPSEASAQLSFEGRVGSAIPTGELTNEPGLDQTAGFSFAVDGMVGLNDLTTVYAGVSRQSFNCDGCSTDVSTTGFNGGLKLILGSGVALPWVRGGLMLHRAEIDASSNDWGLGVDAGVGIDWRVSPAISVVPALRVNSYGSGPLSLTYVTLDMGLHIHPSELR